MIIYGNKKEKRISVRVEDFEKKSCLGSRDRFLRPLSSAIFFFKLQVASGISQRRHIFHAVKLILENFFW